MKFAINFKTSAFGLCLGAALSGCAAVGPDYAPPTASLEAQFIAGGSASLKDAAQLAWWKDLRDPLLNGLVAKGLTQNLDIAASLERIEAARIALRGTGVNTQISGGISGQAQRSYNGFDYTDSRAVSANAQYVFDLFGGVRRDVEQARAGLEGAQFDAATVRLGYLAEIVSSYLAARYFQNAAEIGRQTVERQRRTLGIVRIRLDAGDATQLELQQAQQALDQARANLPILQSGFEGNVFRIATLIAEPAGPLLTQMQKGAPLNAPARVGRAGVPADLIRNRPDLRAAERSLAAATAAIGIAEAQLYPSLTLSGAISETATPSVPGSASLTTWNFGPTISFPVFNRGLLKAQRDSAVSQARQLEIAWRNAVFGAVEDVQSSLSTVRGIGGQVASLRRATASSERLLSLALDSYEVGASPITDVLEAQAALSNTRLSLLAARRDYALAWVELQIAAGKGWYVE